MSFSPTQRLCHLEYLTYLLIKERLFIIVSTSILASCEKCLRACHLLAEN